MSSVHSSNTCQIHFRKHLHIIPANSLQIIVSNIKTVIFNMEGNTMYMNQRHQMPGQQQMQQTPPPPPPPEPTYRFRWELYIGIPLTLLFFFWLFSHIEISFEFQNIIELCRIYFQHKFVRFVCLIVICLSLILAIKSFRNHPK